MKEAKAWKKEVFNEDSDKNKINDSIKIAMQIKKY